MDRGSLTSRIVSGIARVTDNPESVRGNGDCLRGRTSFVTPPPWPVRRFVILLGAFRSLVRRFVTTKNPPPLTGETIRDERNLLHHLHPPAGDLTLPRMP